MKKLLLICFVTGYLTSFGSPLPYICFTDLTSGPSTGNSDNSQSGQVAGQDGAIVTLWGKNLGSSQGTSQILIGGQTARIYSWANASSPAELFTSLGLQMIAFQVPGSLPIGNTEIKVVVNGITSNSVPFTVRNGNIYFVKTTGNDNTGDGSWTNPWESLDNLSNTGALDKITVGDIIYLCNGVKHEDNAGDRACIDLGNPGSLASPKAIVGYPGAFASIGNPNIQKSYSLWVSGIGPTFNWIISKLHLVASGDVAGMYHNFRLVGNKITAPNGNGPTGAIAGQGNNLYVLGNELTTIGFVGTSKLYHPIYIQSAEACTGPRLPTETNREIAWNNLHDNLSYDGINIYRECSSSAYMTDHRVHDNVIFNQVGCGIRIGDYVTGENWIYNNLVINAGLGPDPPGDEAMHVPVYIHPGWEGTTTLIHFYNNTIYGGGFTGGAAWSSSMVGFANTHPYTLDFRNNIIVSTVSGIDYLNTRLDVPAGGVENNLWYGGGSLPSWDVHPIGVNPLFINPIGNNFRLLEGSQAIDGALPITATVAQPLPTHDFDRVVRPQNGVTDLGAFEFESLALVPIVWQQVSANRDNDHQATVSWMVSGEQDVKDYLVEYSEDGSTFSNSCIIVAARQSIYSCKVPALSSGKTYYRVLQRDNNGRKNYSRTVVLNGTSLAIPFSLYPNPANEFTDLHYSIAAQKTVVILLYNSNGVMIRKQVFVSGISGFVRIPLTNLPAGLYNLRVQLENLWHTVKIIKK